MSGPSMSLGPRPRFALHLVAAWALVALALIAASMWVTDGRLVYSLDDAYIHLSVAETILTGGYGVNAGEYALPSSSILYPLLLVVTEALGLGAAGPLVVNLLAMALAVFVVGRLLAEHVLPGEALVGARSPLWARLALGLACLAVMNAWGLVMTGMEHSLHVLLAVTVLWRLARIDDAPAGGRRGADPLLVAACVALPLVRFEGLALTLAASVALIGLRRFAAAAAILALTGVALGLPWLPSSVLTKSEFAARVLEQRGAKALAQSIALNLRTSLLDRQGALLILGATVAALGAARALVRGQGRVPGAVAGGSPPAWRADLVCGAVAVAVAAAHLVFGRYGWFSRYEVYAVVFVALACLVLARASLARGDARVAATVTLLAVGAPYLVTTAETPWASRGTYDQQHQMHRFVVEHWRRPIAANDLGWLTYRNPHYVLDLWGLGSEAARRMARRGGLNAAGIGEFVRERGIDLAIVYHRSLFTVAPAGWVRVAVLRSDVVTGADSEVGFFATSSAPVEELRALLQEFAPTLPSRVKLTLAAADAQ